MSDYLQKLPTELQLAILRYLPDLPCLYRLSCASRSMNAVFESRPVEILEAIMSDLTWDLKYLLRANAVALASTLIDIAPLDAGYHYELYRREHAYMSLKLQDCVNPLPPTMPLATVQQLVLMSCRIEDLAVSFFNTYLTRFNRIEVESMPPLTPASGNVLSQSGNPQARENKNFTPRAIRFISWCEYYRVTSSLWQIQLGFSTCDLSKMKSLWSKMVAEADRLIRYTQLTGKWAPWEQDTMVCVKEFLEEKERTLMNTSLKHLQNESDTFTTPTQSQFVLPLIASPSPNPSRLENSESGSIQHGSSAYIWFSAESAWVIRGLFEEKDWQHFRRLGFGIWDRKRMMCMGLMNRIVDETDPTLGAVKSSADHGRKMTPGQQASAWKSIKLDGRYVLLRGENTT